MKAIIKETGEIINVEHTFINEFEKSPICFYCKDLGKTFSIGELDFDHIVNANKMITDSRKWGIVKMLVEKHIDRVGKWSKDYAEQNMKIICRAADDIIDKFEKYK